MQPELALDMAKYMRPGAVIVVGAVDARIETETPADTAPLWRKHRIGIKPAHEYPRYQSSWWRRDLYNRTGLDPSIWATEFGLTCFRITGTMPSDEEWQMLCKPLLSLVSARQWLKEKISQHLNQGA